MSRNRHQTQPSSNVVTADALRRSQLATESLIAAAGAAGVLTFNSRSGAVSLTSGDVTTALGFTPASSAGGVPDGDKGQIVVSGGGTVWNLDTGAAAANLGFTPYNATNPAGYISGITSGMVTTALGFTPQPAGSYLTSITGAMVTTALGYTPTSVTGLTGAQTVAAFKTGLSLVKADVGLGSADNTADSTKAVLSATKLTTARTINGTSFDGTANITISAVDTATPRLASSAASAFGLTLIDDADAATARATLGAQAAGSYLTGNQTITFSGDATGSGTTAVTLTLATVNSNVGTFGSSTLIPVVTVDGKGRITAISTVAAAGGGAPTTRLISTTAPLTGGGDLSADRTLSISAATTTTPGSMSAADKTKLDGIATGAQTGTITAVTGTAPIASSGGTTPAISIGAATTAAAGSMSAADKTKLDAITGTNSGDETGATIKTKIATQTSLSLNTDKLTFTHDGTNGYILGKLASGDLNIGANGAVQLALKADGSGAAFTGVVSATGNIFTTGAASILVTGTGGVGYATGAGGAATQATSRTTGVTINKPSGAITMFSTTTTANQVTTFTVTCSSVAIGDVPNVSVRTATGIYIATVTKVVAGSFNISIFTPVAVTVAEAPIINFAVVKAVSA